MRGKIKYVFTAQVWQASTWYFISLPAEISQEIRTNLKWQEEGWGRLKASAQIGKQQWETAIWFDTKRNAYLLPLKAEIRKKANIATGDTVEASVWV